MNKEKTFNYREQYGVIIVCKDEKEQIKIFEKLKQEGLTLKIVCV